MENIVALVTGGSSGIGLYSAQALKDNGCTVYEFSRRESFVEGIQHISCDVTDEKMVLNAVREIIEKEGKIDILVNCAGFGISGAVEFTALEDAKNQFDVNFFGAVNVSKAVIPYMRDKHSGRIVNVSSVAAVTHIPFQAYYSASKAALESYSFALDNEVGLYGISVTVVQPGDICTEFTKSRKKSFEGDDIYGGRISRSVCSMEKDEEKGMSPDFAGRYICKIALQKSVKPVYAIGSTYKLICVLCKVFPSRIRNRIVGLLYAR